MGNLPNPVTREEIYLKAIAEGSGGGGASSADDVTYDNTSSGLNATNVQDAIDEVAQGSGGSSNVAIVEFDYNGGLITSVDDAVDIKALVDAGKCLMGVIHATPTQTTQLVINVIDFTSTNQIIAYAFNGISDTRVVFNFIAADLNEGTKFVISG